MPSNAFSPPLETPSVAREPLLLQLLQPLLQRRVDAKLETLERERAHQSRTDTIVQTEKTLRLDHGEQRGENTRVGGITYTEGHPRAAELERVREEHRGHPRNRAR